MQKSKLTPMGQRIHAGMLAAGITSAAELARRTGVAPPTMHRWLYEPLATIDATTLFRLADALTMSARWIVLGEGPPCRRIAATPDVARLVDHFEALPPNHQSILLHAASTLARAP